MGAGLVKLKDFRGVGPTPCKLSVDTARPGAGNLGSAGSPTEVDASPGTNTPADRAS